MIVDRTMSHRRALSIAGQQEIEREREKKREKERERDIAGSVSPTYESMAHSGHESMTGMLLSRTSCRLYHGTRP